MELAEKVIRLGHEAVMDKIKFSASYMESPFFNAELSQMGPVDVREMGLSKELEERVERWDHAYQATLSSEYPPDSKFETNEELEAHNREGLALFQELQKELGEVYEITYMPNSL